MPRTSLPGVSYVASKYGLPFAFGYLLIRNLAFINVKSLSNNESTLLFTNRKGCPVFLYYFAGQNKWVYVKKEIQYKRNLLADSDDIPYSY